jgi:hypothetical protein
MATFEPDYNSQGIAPSLIIIRVALGLSNTPSGGLHNGGTGSVLRPVSTHVCLGNSSTAFSNGGQRFPTPEIPMSQVELKSFGEDLGSVENATNV